MSINPTIPPNTRTNTTATPDDHPDDHNQISDALTTIVAQVNKAPYCLFDHYANVGNVGTGEDDLYSDTMAAGLLAANGDKIELVYETSWAASATATRRVRVYFGGTAILDTGAYASTFGGVLAVRILVQRVSASVVRASTTGSFPAVSSIGTLPVAAGFYAEVTGLTLANTQVVKITGEASGTGAATDDIIARQGYGLFIPAA